MTPQELAELDLAVAKAEGHTVYTDGACWHKQDGTMLSAYQPTRDGAEAMRLLEKYELQLMCLVEGDWLCCGPNDNDKWKRGPTPAIAICRAVVALNATQPPPGATQR